MLSFFCQSGTEAVEGALKLARYVSGRSRFIGFLGGFHGRTMGSLAFTASKQTQQQGCATMPGVTHVPFPNPYHPLFAGDDQGQAVLDYIENGLFVSNVPASEVAAILIEPIQGEGGYMVPPDGFLAGLRQLCDRHGILLIFDEVQSGIGRTGKMFACQHWNVQPDIMTLAKGLGSGLPIGLVVAKKKHHATMEVWRACEHLRWQSALLRGGVGDTRPGRTRVRRQCRESRRLFYGPLARVAVTAPSDRGSSWQRTNDRHGAGQRSSQPQPCKFSCHTVITRAFHRGLLLLSCGQSTVRFMPPLMVSVAQVDEAITLLEAALIEAMAQ